MSALSPVGLAVVFLLTVIGSGQVVRESWAGRPVYRGRHRRDDGIAIFYAEKAERVALERWVAEAYPHDDVTVVRRPLGAVELYPGGAWWAPTP